MKKLIVATCFLLLAAPSMAADQYVLDGGTSSTCSSWSDACDQITTAESRAGRGDTIWVADGTYTGGTFNTPVSDSTYIYVKKATAAAHGTETGWSDSYGDGVASFTSGFVFGSNYWDVDGLGRTSTTSGHGIKITSATKCATVTGCSYITLKYIDMQGAGDDGDGPGNDLIYASSAASYITISYCYLHDTGRTHLLSRGGNYWTLEHSYVARNESIPLEHSESWSIGTTSNTTVRYNVFDTIEGTAVIATLDSPTGPSNWYIYGNVFLDYAGESNGLIATDSDSYWTNLYFYNNSVIRSDCRFDAMGHGTGWTEYNNIFYVCNAGPSFRGTHDYNAYSSNLGEAHDQENISAGTFTNYAGEDFTLSGPTLAADSSIGATYNTDPLGTTRGADGTWDRGAYEYTDAVPTPTPIPRGAASATIRNGSIH